MTPAQLYDELQSMFGIGDYDDSSDNPWHRARAVEIAKIARMLKKRHCTAEEVLVAAKYARRTGKPIHAAWQVFVLVPEALKAARLERARDHAEALDAAIRDAIDDAVALGENEWAARLIRTPRTHVVGVLDEWRNHVSHER